MRKAKIVATIGPASQGLEVLTGLIDAGVNVCRMNMSHGDYDFHKNTISTIRKASSISGKTVAILMDLQGPKIRVDKLQAPIEIKSGEKYHIGLLEHKVGENFIPTTYKNLVKDAKIDDRVLFDDGLLEAVVVDKTDETIEVKIITGGLLKSNKGINLPDTDVSAPSLTKKDKADLMWGLEQDIDFIALSFVRNAADILKVKEIIKESKVNKQLPIIAKIEKPEALDNIEAIVEASDGIMIARGDMAVEVGIHLVPKIQKMIIRLCNKAGKPVITATQMLESMTQNTTPTRAEASDVANSVWDGTDALMLSGETAAGIDPVNVVKTMHKIIVEAETLEKKRKNLLDINDSFTSNLQLSATVLAENTKAKLIISVSERGVSTQRLSAFRPKVPILGLTNSEDTLRRMCLMWGVTPQLIMQSNIKTDEVEKTILTRLINDHELKKEDVVVFCRANSKKPYDSQNNCVKVQKI
jgi:pyruvate kinase